MRPITFGSVCSGIEAASVAWHRFGWRAAWLAEIEKFPALLLHHHYGSGRPHHMPDPDDPDLDQDERDERAAAIKAMARLPLVPANSTTVPPNLGDMGRIEAMVRAGQVAAPDILCGGTPCQAFSLAGLRASMEDARGQLTLSFVRLADAIDTARHVRGESPAVIVWENVFGVLSTKDNAFGTFLGALAGEDSPLVPPRTGWSNAGCVFGPRRTVSWRVYDAQYFGVAQRRRRVFVVASAREDVDPSEILLEFDGVRRDFAPRREEGQDTAFGLGGGIDYEGNGHSIGEPTGPLLKGSSTGGGHPLPAVAIHCVQVAPTMRAGGNKTGGDRPPGTDVDTADSLIAYSGALRGLEGGDKPHVLGPSYAIQAGALRINPNSGPDGVGVQEGIAYTLEARAEVQAVCFAENSRGELRLEGGDGQRTGALSTGGGKPGQGHPVIAFRAAGQDGFVAGEIAPPVTASTGGCSGVPTAQYGLAVRRLTPRECERLQDFPDDYTLIPIGIITRARAEKLLADGEPVRQDSGGNWWKMSADGPRYKALGNSWAVANVVWLGRRLDRALRQATQVAA